VWCRSLDEILGHSGTSLAICSRAGEFRRPPTHLYRLLKIVSGPLLLYQAAADALKKWKYEPTHLNDQPIAVQTIVAIKFVLGQ
jgi:hypothetical protein